MLVQTDLCVIKTSTCRNSTTISSEFGLSIDISAKPKIICFRVAPPNRHFSWIHTESAQGFQQAATPNPINKPNFLKFLVTQAGFEPATCPLGGGCSIQLSH